MQSVDDFLNEHKIAECRRDFVKHWMNNGGVPPRILARLKKEALVAKQRGRPVGSKSETQRRRDVLMKVIENPAAPTQEMLETQKVLIALDAGVNEQMRLKSLAKELAEARTDIEKLKAEVAAKDAEIA